MSSLYGDPSTYDVLMGPGTATELDALARVEKRFAPRVGAGAAWFEPACGTGRLLRGAARRGRRVAGYDGEPAMLAYARGRLAPEAARRVVVADLAAAPAGLRRLGLADLAFCPWNTLRHLGDDDAMLAHFAQVRALLRAGGVYAVGLSLQDWALADDDEDVWRGARGRLVVTQVVTYLPLPARRERVISHLMVARPQGALHLDHVYDLRTYTQAQWLRLLARSPLQRVAVCDIAGRPVADDAALAYRLEILAAR
jgi:SAM-dependent methyltransferase